MMWNPAWESGVRLIDEQHRQLLAQFESLMAAIHSDSAKERVPGILAFLAAYVETHFSTEEACMRAAEYPGLVEHQAIHDQMRAQVTRLVDESTRDSTTLTEELVDFLTEWLLGHINEVDRPMAQFLLRYGFDGMGTVQ
jgi:hemerythrin-like metal-binding protein